jgi:hypothetical protein
MTARLIRHLPSIANVLIRLLGWASWPAAVPLHAQPLHGCMGGGGARRGRSLFRKLHGSALHASEKSQYCTVADICDPVSVQQS